MKTLTALILILITALSSGCAIQRSINRTEASNKLAVLCRAGDVQACNTIINAPSTRTPTVHVVQP